MLQAPVLRRVAFVPVARQVGRVRFRRTLEPEIHPGHFERVLQGGDVGGRLGGLESHVGAVGEVGKEGGLVGCVEGGGPGGHGAQG